MANITIAIDCMGGDFGPSITIPAIKAVFNRIEQSQYSESTPDSISFQLFGNELEIKQYLSSFKLSNHPNISLFASENDVLMTDKPVIATKQSISKLSIFNFPGLCQSLKLTVSLYIP